MDTKLTQRGFRLGHFTDANGVKCSIQESSAVGDDGSSLLWLGCREIGLKRLEPGKGWSDIELMQDGPGGVMHQANTRMHLTQGQVEELLPILEFFVKHGRLPEGQTRAKVRIVPRIFSGKSSA